MANSEHLSKQFDADLDQLRTRVLQMGGLVEAQIRAAVEAYSSGNVEGVEQIIVEFGTGFLFVTAMGESAALGVITEKDCELGLVAFEMTLLVERGGTALTPALLAELKNLLTV